MRVLIHRVVLLCMVTLSSIAVSPASCRQDDIETINQIWASGNAAFESGNIKEAQDRLAEFIKMVPFEPSSRVLMARCQARLGDSEGAINSLARACELGWEDSNSVKSYGELDKLFDMPATAKVLADMDENRNRQFVLYSGKMVDRKKAAPLIVLFHGRGELPAMQLHFWRKAADRAGWIILAVKGTRKAGSVYAWERANAKNTWDVDIEAILARTRSSLREITASNKVSVVVLAGFSQGGIAAFEMLRSELMPRPAGCVLFATAFPELSDKKFPSSPELLLHPIIVHVGQKDRWLKGNQEVVCFLKKAGASIEFKIWEGLGHQMPPDHTQVILDAVGKILDKQDDNLRHKSG